MAKLVFMNLLRISQNIQVTIKMEISKDGGLPGSKMVKPMKVTGTKVK